MGLRNKLLVFGFTLIAVSVLSTGNTHASADTCYWNGSVSNSISNPANWDSCDNSHTPEAVDDVVFPFESDNKTVDVDADVSYHSMSFSWSGFTFNRSGSQSITIAGSSGGIKAAGNTTFNVPVTFGDGTTTNLTSWVNEGSTVDFTLGTTLDLTGDMQVGSAGHNGSFLFEGVISGNADRFFAEDNGVINTLGANTFTANKVGAINNAGYYCFNDNCFGNSNNTIYLEGGVLRFENEHTIGQDLEIATVTSGSTRIDLLANVTFSGNITANDSLYVFTHTDTAGVFNGNIAIADGALLTVTGDTPINSGATINGVISGDGGLAIEDCGVDLTAPNTYNGETIVSGFDHGSKLGVTDSNGLGSTDGDTTIESGGTLSFWGNNDVYVPEPIQVSGDGFPAFHMGAIVNVDKSATLNGGLTLNGDTTLTNNSSGILAVGSKITGTGNLTLDGDFANSQIFLSSPEDNDFDGDVESIGARLWLWAGGDGNQQIPHNLTLRATNTNFSDLSLLSDGQIADDTTINLINSDNYTANISVAFSTHETVGTVIGNGVIDIQSSDDSLTLANSTNSTFSGELHSYNGGGHLIKDGSGTWTFNGKAVDINSSGYGDVEVKVGTLIAEASDSSLQHVPISITGGTLGGSGVIGAIDGHNGVISPGHSPGCLTPIGNVTMNSNLHFTVQLNGTTVCSQYDQLNVNGNVTISGAKLNTSLGFASKTGNKFTILKANSITGNFQNLGNDTILTVRNRNLRINYTSTAITLTDVGAAATSSGLANTGMSATALYIYVFILVGTSIVMIYNRRHLN